MPPRTLTRRQHTPEEAVTELPVVASPTSAAGARSGVGLAMSPATARAVLHSFQGMCDAVEVLRPVLAELVARRTASLVSQANLDNRMEDDPSGSPLPPSSCPSAWSEGKAFVIGSEGPASSPCRAQHAAIVISNEVEGLEGPGDRRSVALADSHNMSSSSTSDDVPEGEESMSLTSMYHGGVALDTESLYTEATASP